MVQITNKENEIQYYSCEENSVVKVEEIISDVHLEEVFSVQSISRHVIKDKQNIQHGSISLRLSPAVEPVDARHKTDGQESVVFTFVVEHGRGSVRSRTVACEGLGLWSIGHAHRVKHTQLLYNQLNSFIA